MPLPPTYKFCPIHALIELYTKFGSDPRLSLPVNITAAKTVPTAHYGNSVPSPKT